MRPSILLPIATALLLAGCATTRTPRGPVLGATIAVINFQGPETPTTQREIRGWWLGARDIMTNPNAGGQAADEFTRQLSQIPNVTTIPRVRLKYYFADKRALLEKKLGKLDDPQALKNYYRTPPQAFGQQLGADFIIRGRVNQSYTARNRTIDNFWSHVDLSAEVIDCATGKTVWIGAAHKTKHWGTTVGITQRIIAKLINRFDREFLLVR